MPILKKLKAKSDGNAFEPVETNSTVLIRLLAIEP